MIYKFQSKATADLIMLGPHGDAVMRLLGRVPASPGIIEVADMPGVIALLERAVADDEASRERAEQNEPSDDSKANETDADEGQLEAGVSLRQRLWPLLDNMKLAHAQAQPLVWGV